MYVSQAKLPHLLQIRHERVSTPARSRVVRRSWHLVGTTAELCRDGDFLTVQIAGIPIQVRNFRGQLRAVSMCRHQSACADLFEALRANCYDAMPIPWMGVSRGWTHWKDPEPKNFVPIEARFVSFTGLQFGERRATSVRQS